MATTVTLTTDHATCSRSLTNVEYQFYLTYSIECKYRPTQNGQIAGAIIKTYAKLCNNTYEPKIHQDMKFNKYVL